jgi:hypothetical protein
MHGRNHPRIDTIIRPEWRPSVGTGIRDLAPTRRRETVTSPVAIAIPNLPKDLSRRADGKPSFDPPKDRADKTDGGFDSYVSDPAKPVPFSAEIRTIRGIREQIRVAAHPHSWSPTFRLPIVRSPLIIRTTEQAEA